MSDLWSRFVSDESGAVAILVALAFPVFLLGAVLAVDVSRWNVHKRQLQQQADGAALAGASVWRFPCDSAAQTSIVNVALKYAGDGAGALNRYADIPDAKHHVLINSPTYYRNRAAADPGGPTLHLNQPCTDNAIDVKVTEDDAKAFFWPFTASHIDATARAELKTATGVLGMSPVGVPQPTPAHVYAQFVNESGSSPTPYTVTGTGVLADNQTFSLGKLTGTSDPVLWKSLTVVPQGVQPSDRIGVRVILDANDSLPMKNGAPDCTAAGVECDSNESSWNSLVSIRQWPAQNPDGGATNFIPYVTSLTLDRGACATPYFADVPVSPGTGCKMGIYATAKFNPTATPNTKPAQNKESITATLGGTGYPLTYVGNDLWQATGANGVPVLPNSGSSTVTLKVTQGEGNVHGTGNTNKCPQASSLCTVTYADAQRVYGANSTTSGYVQSVEVDQPGVANPNFANSLNCSAAPCTYGLTVMVGVATFRIAAAGDRPITLRVANSGSQNGAVDCDPNNTASLTKLSDQIASGCNVAYRVANGNECDSVQNVGSMAPNPPNPYPCVATFNGNKTSQVADGMSRRLGIKGGSCGGAQDNQWDSGSPNDLSPSDKRRLTVFLTDFGSFTSSGHQFYPVRGFAEFYVTGWTGQEKGNGNKNPVCAKNDPVPTDNNGYLVGHFIKDVAPPGVPDNGQPCDPTDLNLCTAVLTR